MQLPRFKALLPHADEQKRRADEHDAVEREREDTVDGTSGVAEVNEKRDKYQHSKHVERSSCNQHWETPEPFASRDTTPVPRAPQGRSFISLLQYE